MVLTTIQVQALIAQLNNLYINPHSITDQVNDVIISFEGKTNNGYSQRINIYIQAKKEIEK